MAFAIGLSVEEFRHLNPYKLEQCIKGYNLKRKARDEEAWLWVGKYVTSSLQVVLDQAFNGRQATSKYPQEPILTNPKVDFEEMSEEELEIQRSIAFAQLTAELDKRK